MVTILNYNWAYKLDHGKNYFFKLACLDTLQTDTANCKLLK